MSEGVVTPHQLCKNCVQFWKSATCLRFTPAQLSTLGSGAPEMPQHLLHSAKYLEVTSGASEGCHFCSIIVGACSGCTGAHEASLEPNPEEPLYGSISVLNERDGSFGISLFPCEQSDITEVDGFAQLLNHHRFRVVPTGANPQLPDDDNIKGAKLSRLTTSTFSDATAAMILNWFHKCRTSHEMCRLGLEAPARATPARPKRLLYLGARDDLDYVQLVDNDTSVERAYTALSYSWGFSQQFLMTSANMDSFRQGIRVSDLPKTMRDAIEVTRRLHIRYIWIDAFCIMQDSKTAAGFHDWVDQASIMNDIFSGSVATVAASEAFGANEGFIQSRHPLRQTTLNLSFEGGKSLFDVIPPCTPHCGLHSFLNGQYHLDTRSWVMQERLLSPRTIHFTKNFVHLECKGSFSCEGVVESPEHEFNCHHRGLRVKYSAEFFSFLGPGAIPDFMVEYFLSSWHKIVQEYSCTNMSHQTDRLIALAGLASQLKGDFLLTPTFGLWKEHLLRGMLWYLRLGHGIFSGRGILRHDRAPSWSWACIDSNGLHIYVEACQSVELVATLIAVPETFEFTHLGGLRSDDTRYIVKISAPFKTGAPANAFDMESDPPRALVDGIRTHPNCLSKLHPECPFHPDYELPGNIALYSVLIGRGGDGVKNDMVELGLVVTPSAEQPGRYRRVGYFHHSMRHQKDGPNHVPLASIFEGCSTQEVEII